jgi:hypothetical protein
MKSKSKTNVEWFVPRMGERAAVEKRVRDVGGESEGLEERANDIGSADRNRSADWCLCGEKQLLVTGVNCLDVECRRVHAMRCDAR